MRGHGFEVSTEGLVFALPAKTAPDTLTITATIRAKSIELAVMVLRKDAMVMQETFWTKFACRITQADTALWDQLIEAVPARSLPQPIPPGVEAVLNKQRSGATKAPAKPPVPPLAIEIKGRIAKLMVKRERMDPWRAGEPPAIAFEHLGEEKDPLGRSAQHYKVDTKRSRHGKTEALSTVVAVVDGGELLILKE